MVFGTIFSSLYLSPIVQDELQDCPICPMNDPSMHKDYSHHHHLYHFSIAPLVYSPWAKDLK